MGYKHGKYRTRSYRAWESMKRRCFNSKVALIEGGRIVEIRQDYTAVQTTVQIRRDQLPELVYQLAAIAEALAKA